MADVPDDVSSSSKEAPSEEAAELDGAGPLRTFVQVIVPLARPGIVTVLVLNVIGLWNSTLLVMVIAPGEDETPTRRAVGLPSRLACPIT